MAKISLITVESLENQTTAVQALNENFGLIADAFETTLSRDGTTPNQMTAELDMNSQKVINLGPPISGSDAARLVDITDVLALDGLTAIPAMSGHTDELLSNDGSILVWKNPSDIAGLGDVISTNNLSDLSDIATARTNLGLGTGATYNIAISGANLALLNGANVWSGNQVFTGTNQFTEAVLLGGSVDHRIISTPLTMFSDSIGFRGIPVETKDVAYQFVLNDSGRMKLHTSATPHTYTLPANATVAYPTGTVLVVCNTGAGAITIGRAGSVVLRRVGVSTDADASVAQWGFASLIKIGTNTWVISGTGVS